MHLVQCTVVKWTCSNDNGSLKLRVVSYLFVQKELLHWTVFPGIDAGSFDLCCLAVVFPHAE